MPRKKLRYTPLTSSQHVVRGRRLTELQRVKAQAEALGALIVHKPAATRSDGSPLLQEGEVYVTAYGQRYHTSWCQVVAERWDTKPKGLFVSYLWDVGGRTECGTCTTPLTSSAAPRETSTEKLDREYAEKKARIADGERRRNGG
jgi:hypothetical protein